mmetsp:Transcript_58530/g.119711  ORF Transcript_58530/g.119711 Transcript_58530/m.119711 type:complete len:788 (-) Transcript_58530:49-2412(-)
MSMERILRGNQAFRSIQIVESSMRLENKLVLRRGGPSSQLDEGALVEYEPSQRNTTGLLVQSEWLKNPDDLEGWEVKPSSFLASCNITIMIGSSLSTAVPAEKGSLDWKEMRGEYINTKEAAIKEVHWETHRVLSNFLTTLDEEEGVLDTMSAEVLYNFGNCVSKVLASLNKVVAPLLSVRMPRPGAVSLSPPPTTSDPDYTAELVSRWLLAAGGTIKKALPQIRRQCQCLGDVLEDVKESLEAEAASAATSAASSPTLGMRVPPRRGEGEGAAGGDEPVDPLRDHRAAVVHISGDQPDSEPTSTEALSPQRLLTGLSTFFVRRADHRACQELLDRVGEAQDCYSNRGEHEPGTVAHNMLTAIRRVKNQTLKLGVHRQSLMPNEFELVRKMRLFRGGMDSSDLICEVAGRLKPLLFSAQQSIIRQGTIGMGMYFVNDGTCSVNVAGNQVAKLGFGDFFGEVALTMASQRTANVEAQGLVELFELTRHDLKAVTVNFPHLLMRLKEQGKVRVQRACTAKIQVVEDEDGEMVLQDREPGQRARSHSMEVGAEGMEDVGIQLVGGGAVDPSCLSKLKYLCSAGAKGPADKVTEEEWEAIVGQMQRVRVRHGEKVVGDGVTESHFYIIEHGVCVVTMGDLELSKLTVADFFGEVRLMLTAETSADVHAEGQCSLLRLSRSSLCSVLDSHGLLYQNLLQVATRRLAVAQRNHKQFEAGCAGPFERLPSAPTARLVEEAAGGGAERAASSAAHHHPLSAFRRSSLGRLPSSSTTPASSSSRRLPQSSPIQSDI